MVDTTTYDVLKLMEEQKVLNVLVVKGIVSVDWLDHLNIYRTFKKYLDEGERVMEAYKIAATIHSVHPNTVYLVRKKMEG